MTGREMYLIWVGAAQPLQPVPTAHRFWDHMGVHERHMGVHERAGWDEFAAKITAVHEADKQQAIAAAIAHREAGS